MMFDRDLSFGILRASLNFHLWLIKMLFHSSQPNFMSSWTRPAVQRQNPGHEAFHLHTSLAQQTEKMVRGDLMPSSFPFRYHQ